MINRWNIILVLLVWSTTVGTCLADGHGRGATGKKSHVKSLDFAVPFAFDGNYDPVERNLINLSCMFNAIYSPMFRLDKRVRPYPFLIENYRRDGKTVTISIRKDARFSDGSAITSADIIASLESGMAHLTYASPVYKLIEGGDDFFKRKTEHCSGFKILSPKSFEIRFLHSESEFSHYFATVLMSVLPKNRKSHLRFSGPYQVVNQENRSKKTVVTLQRNPWYLGKKTRIDIIRIHFYKKHKDFETAILRGEPDLFLYNRRFNMPRSRHDYKFYKTPSFGGLYFKLNAVSGPFKDKRLRLFFRDFVLSQDYGKSQKWTLSTPAFKILPYNLMGYSVFKSIKVGDYSQYAPEKKITIRTVNKKSGFRIQFLPLLKKELAAYDIDLRLEWDSLLSISEREKKRDLDMTVVFYLVDIPQTAYFYENLFTPGHELNLFGYEVPEATRLLTEYREEKNQLKKLRILSRLEQIAQDECIVVPLVNPLALLGYKDHVSNVSIDKFLHIYFEDMDVHKRN